MFIATGWMPGRTMTTRAEKPVLGGTGRKAMNPKPIEEARDPVLRGCYGRRSSVRQNGRAWRPNELERA